MAGKKKTAKDEDKAGFRLPKSVAGAKLPKEARRKLGQLAKHPIVADILAAGLVALAARITTNRKVKRAAADAAAGAKEAATNAGQQAVAAVSEAATTVANPVVKRVRKASSTTATAPRRASAKPAAKAVESKAAKPAGKSKAGARAAAAAPAKPRASRRATPKTAKAPKAPAKSE